MTMPSTLHAIRTALLATIVFSNTATARAADAIPFPGTRPLRLEKPLDVEMVDGINRFALRALANSAAARPALPSSAS